MLIQGEKVITFTSQAKAHKPNLVVFREVFADVEHVFLGPDCLHRFIEFMLGVNNGRNLLVAHNASGYDSRLILDAALTLTEKKKIVPIRRGLKYMELRIENVIFRDSLLFLPSSLANLAKSFNLSLRKGIFPHLFNTPENIDYEGKLPDKKYFDLTFFAKSSKEIDDFNKWYTDREKTVWNFKKELIEYCRDDVKILGMIVLMFHEICVEKFQHSPWSNVTAPSYVHKVVIDIISKKLDLPEDREERSMIIKNTPNVWAALLPEEYWFVRNALRGGRTDARTLLYELSEEDKAKGLKIKYVDVVSMYPAVQVKYKYPVGTPKIHIYDDKFYPCKKHQNPLGGMNSHSKRCDCLMQEKYGNRDLLLNIIEHDNQPTINELRNMFGFICVSCEPNKHLFHPPLVAWDSESLKCVASLETIVEGYFTTEEFICALDKGYKVIKVHRIDEYESCEGLWNDFIKDLYIEKLANSDPPPSPQEQQRLANAYEQEFGMGQKVKNSFSRWKYDGALRTVFKTLLNSGWGKHCQRPNMDEHVILDQDGDWDAVFDDIQTGIIRATRTEILPNGHINISTKNTSKTRLKTHQNYIPAGCYVPAYGRLTLFNQMDKLGDRVLYHDTDSIIYVYDPEKYNIPTSDIWGEWDEEKISKKGIDAFVSLGPKSYGIKAGSETIIKLKGLSVKHAHRNMVNFDVLKNLLLNHMAGNYPTIQVPQMRFTYRQGLGMATQNFLKNLKFTPDALKGNLMSNMKVFPFGYCENPFGNCKECLRQ